MKTSGRENPNSRARLCNEPSPRSGKPKPFALVQKGWKVRNYPAGGEVFFLTFPFIELHRNYLTLRRLAPLRLIPAFSWRDLAYSCWCTPTTDKSTRSGASATLQQRVRWVGAIDALRGTGDEFVGLGVITEEVVLRIQRRVCTSPVGHGRMIRRT